MSKSILQGFTRQAVRASTALVLVAAAFAAGSFAAPAHAAGPEWEQLTVAERKVLAPLAAQWSSIDPVRKEKWRDIAGRYPSLSVAEQQRLQSRMVEWAQLGADERGKARLGYQESRRVPADERQARWQAYQSLPPEQRREFATRAAERATVVTPARPVAGAAASVADAGLPPKSNIVPGRPVLAAPAQAVAPGVVQAPAGATTRPLNQRPAPAAHQPPGQPKITASPGFVDSHTLLPQRGAQGAAVIEPEDKKKRQP